ncbi:MAG: hypothetical protein QGF03_09920, partial [SAR324 cluster bacterium]|nr:hypothetical protein [SAR324 cluster bacterium]
KAPPGFAQGIESVPFLMDFTIKITCFIKSPIFFAQTQIDLSRTFSDAIFVRISRAIVLGCTI